MNGFATRRRIAPLNLASRPLRNESLPNLGFALVLLGVLAVTLQHGVMLWGILPAKASILLDEVRNLESERRELRRQIAALRGPAPDPAKLAEWAALKDLVDKRTFSWSLLLRRIEKVLTPGVRIVSISPSVSAGRVKVELTALARTREDGFELVRLLNDDGAFADALPVSANSGPNGERFVYSMYYTPTHEPPRTAEESGRGHSGGAS
jgi:hypothetical protein